MDNKELEKIYNDTYRSVYWTAMSLLRDEDEAQDIVQETFVTLIDSYDTLKDKNKVAAWLKKIAANKCLDRLRRTKTVIAEDDFFDTVEAQPEDFLPDSIIESDEKRKIIMDIIDNTLSDEVRKTLILFYFDEMTTKEIASLLGIPQGTVLWRLNYAKKKIKKEVEKYEEDNKDKLYTMGIPFLSKLFAKEAEQVPFRPMPASLTKLSASGNTPSKGATANNAAANNAASAAKAVVAKAGSGLSLNTIIMGIIAVVLVIITAVVIINNLVKNSEKTSDETYIETVSAQEIDAEETETEKNSEDETSVDVPTDDEASDASVTDDSNSVAISDSASDLIGIWSANESGGNSFYYISFSADGELNMWEENAVGVVSESYTYSYTVEGNELTMIISGDYSTPTIYSIEGDTLTISSMDNPSDATVFTRVESTEDSVYTAADLVGLWLMADEDTSVYMQIMDDGTVETWVIEAPDQELDRQTGSYTIEGNVLTLTYRTGTDTFNITIDGDMLILGDANRADAILPFTRQ